MPRRGASKGSLHESIMAALKTQQGAILARLLDFQERGLFCDLTLHLQDEQVLAISPLVAAISPVFEAMLTTDMKEKETGEVALPEISRDVWDCILRFHYRSADVVSSENVVELIAACDMYQLDRLKRQCHLRLFRYCTLENCLQLQRVASMFNLHSGHAQIKLYVEDNFASVVKTEDFLNLSVEELMKVLQNFNVRLSEDGLCSALLAWLEVNKADQLTADKVLAELRLRKISNDCLLQDLLRGGLECISDAVKRAVREEMRRRLNTVVLPPKMDEPPPRRGFPAPPLDLLVLGYSGTGMHLLSFSSTRREWQTLPSIPAKRNAAAVRFGRSLLVTGGAEKVERRSTSIFDFESKTWSSGPELIQGRWNHGMVAIGSVAYVVGGRDEAQLTSVEEYSEADPQWHHAGDLHSAEEVCGVVALNDRLIVAFRDIGFATGSNTIQLFDVETKVGTVLRSRLPYPTNFSSGCSLGDMAFLVGRGGDLVQFQLSEDGTVNSRHVRLEDFGRRCRVGLFVDDKHVWVFGGSGSGYLNSVSCYNFHGEIEDGSSISPLPEKMVVYTVLEVKIS